MATRPASDAQPVAPVGADAENAGARLRAAMVAFVIFATWTIGGLFLDGWAHRNDKPETFFSPWHGVLYSGFVAGMIWFGIDALRNARRGIAPINTDGERLSRTGGIVFAAGGAGDFAWHEIFGIEVDLAALLSPTHLLLMLGGLALGVGAMIDPWRAPDPAAERDLATVSRTTMYAAGLGVALIGFFTQFLSPFVLDELPRFEDPQGALVSGMLFTTLLMTAPALLVSRRYAMPRGSVLIASLPLALGLAVLEAGDEWIACTMLVIAAAVVDPFVTGRAPGDARLARVVGIGLPLVAWTGFMAVHAAQGTMHLPAEVWSGAVVLSVLAGFVLSLLTAPPATPKA